MPIRNPAGQFGTSSFVVDPVLGVGSHQTITAALAASSAGDTIIVRPGVYVENLTSNMAGKSIIGSSVGTNAFEVQIIGNHLFSSDAETVAFQSIEFVGSGASTWQIGSLGAGNSSVYLEGCKVNHAGAAAVAITSAGGTGSLQSFFTAITSSQAGISAVNGTLRLEGSTITATASNALQLGAATTVTASNMTFVSPASDAVLISDAGASLNSEISTYTSSGAAFHFTADGTVTTITDTIDASNGSGLFADSTGAFGNLEYASLVLVGSATSIDAQIDGKALVVLSSSGLVTESISGNQALESNHRYFVTTGALSLSLPVASIVGDTLIVRLRGGTSWVITQGASQQIFIGNQSSTLGVTGTLASSADGDSITLICSVANLAWSSESVIGNLGAL